VNVGPETIGACGSTFTTGGDPWLTAVNPEGLFTEAKPLALTGVKPEDDTGG